MEENGGGGGGQSRINADGGEKVVAVFKANLLHFQAAKDLLNSHAVHIV